MQGRLQGQTNSLPNPSSHTPPSSAFTSGPLWHHKGKLSLSTGTCSRRWQPGVWTSQHLTNKLGEQLEATSYLKTLALLHWENWDACKTWDQLESPSHEDPQRHTSSHGTSQKIDPEEVWRTSTQTVWGGSWCPHEGSSASRTLQLLPGLVLMSWLTVVHVNNIYLYIYTLLFVWSLCKEDNSALSGSTHMQICVGPLWLPLQDNK